MNIKELQERISKTMETKLGLVGSHALSSDNFCTINPRTKERINLQPWDVIHRLSNGEVVNYRAATQDDFKDLLTAQDNTKKPFIGEVYDTEIKKNRDILNALDVKRITDRFFFVDDKPINDRLPTFEDHIPPPPKAPPPREITEGKNPKHLSDIPEEMWNENYKPELPPSFIEKYFNSESLHHALVFGSIVFGLKMIEINWSFILGYINSIPIEAVYLMTMVFILSKTMIRMPKTYESGPK